MIIETIYEIIYLKKQGDNTFMYEEALMKICQENFRYYFDPQNYTKI